MTRADPPTLGRLTAPPGRRLARAAGTAIAVLAVGCAPPTDQGRLPVLLDGTPETVGFSSARLARLDTLMDTLIAQRKMAGAAALIARHGTVVYHRARGYDDLAAKTPLRTDAIFRIASQSKAITSVAAMMLYEEGKFVLDDPIAKFLPAFAKPMVLAVSAKGDTTLVPATRPPTVRELLSHTAGLSYPLGGARQLYHKEGITVHHTFGVDGNGERLADAVPRMARVPLMHQPGERYTYGFSVDVLGHLVEVWSGQTLDEFLRTRLFQPLGMRDTYFNVPADKAGRVANFFRIDSTGVVSQERILRFAPFIPIADSLSLGYATDSKVYFGGGGGLSSTLRDYAVFLQMMLNGGEYNGIRFLSPNTVKMMTSDQTGPIDIDAVGRKFGLGFSVSTAASYRHEPDPPGSFAWGGALGTRYWVDPTNGIVALIYRQTWGPDSTGLNQRFPVMVYQALVR